MAPPSAYLKLLSRFSAHIFLWGSPWRPCLPEGQPLAPPSAYLKLLPRFSADIVLRGSPGRPAFGARRPTYSYHLVHLHSAGTYSVTTCTTCTTPLASCNWSCAFSAPAVELRFQRSHRPATWELRLQRSHRPTWELRLQAPGAALSALPSTSYLRSCAFTFASPIGLPWSSCCAFSRHAQLELRFYLSLRPTT